MTNSPESDTPAVQGGLDYTHDSGFYLGYWFSTLTAAYADFNTSPTYVKEEKKSFENDLHAGYKGKITKDLGYQIGGTVYYYYPGWESTGYVINYRDWETDRKSTRLNSSHSGESRMPSSA